MATLSPEVVWNGEQRFRRLILQLPLADRILSSFVRSKDANTDLVVSGQGYIIWTVRCGNGYTEEKGPFSLDSGMLGCLGNPLERRRAALLRRQRTSSKKRQTRKCAEGRCARGGGGRLPSVPETRLGQDQS